MSQVFYKDENISISSESVIVDYGVATESYPLADILSVKLYIPKEEKREAYKRILLTMLVPSWFGWRNALDVLWILRLYTLDGSIDILSSEDGLYLSKVRKALNSAIKHRHKLPEALAQ